MTNYKWKMNLLRENLLLREKWLSCQKIWGQSSESSELSLKAYHFSCGLLTSSDFGCYYKFSAMVGKTQLVKYIYRAKRIKRLDTVRENLAKKLGCQLWPEQELALMKLY